MHMKQWGWLAVALVCGWQVSAHAVEPMNAKAIKQAFENVQIVLQDVPGPEGIPYSNTPWRIVSGLDEMEALASSNIIAQGVTDQQGVVHLDKSLRQLLHGIWLVTPEQLWFVENSRAYLFNPIKNEPGYQVALEAPESAIAKQMRLADEEAARNRNLPIPPETYTQAGFDAKAFTKAFNTWQTHFKADITAVESQLKQNRDYGRVLLQNEDTTQLKHTYANSIHDGVKGLSLRQELLGAYYAGRATEGTEVSPSGKVIMDLLLSDEAKPVGYGGTFVDEGHTVELWYVVFDDMTALNQQDLKESLIFKPFSPLSLPAYQELKRSSWPALVFTREQDGSVKLYGLSRELASILQAVWNAQLF